MSGKEAPGELGVTIPVSLIPFGNKIKLTFDITGDMTDLKQIKGRIVLRESVWPYGVISSDYSEFDLGKKQDFDAEMQLIDHFAQLDLMNQATVHFIFTSLPETPSGNPVKIKAGMALMCAEEVDAKDREVLRKMRRTQVAFVRDEVKKSFTIQQTYRIDNVAEEELGSIHALFWIFFVVFLITISTLTILLKRTRLQASQSLGEVMKEKEQLVEY